MYTSSTFSEPAKNTVTVFLVSDADQNIAMFDNADDIAKWGYLRSGIRIEVIQLSRTTH